MILKVIIVSGLAAIIITAIGLGWIALQIKSYASYWNKQNRRASSAGELIYVALGDSTAQGVGASSPGRSYVAILQRELEHKTGKSVRVVNLSKSGAKIADVLNNQLPKLAELSIKPDIVTIEIGANNIGQFDDTSFKEQFSALSKELPAGTYISDMPYFGGRKRSDAAKAEQASKIISEVIKGGPHHLVELQRVTREHQSLRMYAADWFHPSNYGYSVWAKAFWEQVEHGL